VGVNEGDIEFLTLSAEKQTRLLTNNPRAMSRKDIEEIYRKTL
jgi:alcohol dehydrogenase